MQASIMALCLFFLVAGQSSSIQTSSTRNQHDEISEPQENCPRISVSCPAELKYGDLITFTANVSGGNQNVALVYNWEISTGRIIQGQGSPEIKLDMTGFGGQSPTATVRISGFDSACPATASCSLLPGTPASPAVLFDRYYPKSMVPGAPKKLRARRRAIRRR